MAMLGPHSTLWRLAGSEVPSHFTDEKLEVISLNLSKVR